MYELNDTDKQAWWDRNKDTPDNSCIYCRQPIKVSHNLGLGVYNTLNENEQRLIPCHISPCADNAELRLAKLNK